MKRSVTDAQWEKWGEKNPYFGVLGWESRNIDAADTKTRFFETGQRHIQDVLETVRHRFGALAQNRRAVDFGCGVGRLLPPLAAAFDEVVAIDISPKMIEVARRNVVGCSNITFHRGLEEVAGQADLVHSYIVLQHIRPAQGMDIIERLMRLVAPGGVFVLHVTTGDSRRGRALLNWFRYRITPLHWAYNIARRRPFAEPITEMNRYDAHSILTLAACNGFDGVFVRPLDQAGHRGLVFFGSRPADG
jgi:SAM-dependent methyltransferase